ncbi:hypothetical protein J8J14_22895, partial [Roseomonas sp. SSH11]
SLPIHDQPQDNHQRPPQDQGKKSTGSLLVFRKSDMIVKERTPKAPGITPAGQAQPLIETAD